MSNSILQQVRRMVEDQRLKEASDAELLRRFQTERDEASFHALLRRHGPMVFDVCRAMLHREADVEDAFQTTFLVLARRAGSIRRTASLGSWLYGVAYRTALKAQAERQRRRKHETRAPDRPSPAAEELTWSEVQRALHEELNGLGERHRAPLVLCYLQGQTQDVAAALLGLTKATLKRRLERGRALLRARLVRRGLAPAALLLSAWPAATASAVPATLLVQTAKAAIAAAADQAAPAMISIPATLAEGVLKTMLSSKIAIVTALILALAAVGAGTVMLTYHAAADEPATRIEGKPEAGEKRPARTDLLGDPLPEGALRRMGTARLRHNQYSFLDTAFSPDAKVLATGGREEVRLWDTANGRLLREIRDGYRFWPRLQFSPDGRRLAGWGGPGHGSVRIWDTATGRRLHELPADAPALAWSPDGKWLVTPSKEGSVVLWDAATGRQTAHLRQGHTKSVYDAAFTADGKELVTLCPDNRVCRWDLATGKLRKAVEMPSAVVLSPDGQTLAAIPRGQKQVALMDTDTGTERLRLQGELARKGLGLAFSPDGKVLAANETGLEGWPAEAPISLWDTKTGKLFRRLRLPPPVPVRDLRFAPDGRTLLTAGTEPLVRLWDVDTGKPLHSWAGHEGEIQALAFTPDGRSLVSGSIDATIRLWDAVSGRQVRKLAGHRWRVNAVAVSPDGTRIVSCGSDGCIRMQGLDGKSLDRILLGRAPEAQDLPEHHLLALALTPDGKTATTWGWSGNNVRMTYELWDLATGKARTRRRDSSRMASTRQFSPDAQVVLEYVNEGGLGAPAAGGGAGGAGYGMSRPGATSAVLSEVATGRRLLALPQPDDAAYVQAFAPDGRSLLTVTYRTERMGDDWRHHYALRLWELATGKERLTIPCTSREGLHCAVFAPDGRTLATGTNEGTIQLWDMSTGEELLRRMAPGGRVSCLAFAPDSHSLASGHADGTILVWDPKNGREPKGRPERKADAGQQERWWTDLASDDARRAYTAMRGFDAAPEQTVRFFRDRLRPVVEGPPDKLRQLIADLDSPEFPRREAATKELTALHERALPALRAALDAPRSAEQRQRIKQILDALNVPPSSETLRHLRAVEVLDRIGGDEARMVLETLAAGVPGARRTEEAQAALRRLARRKK